MHYVRNTAGEYTAFVASGHLFTPDCEWLGVLHGTELFDTGGEHVGTLWPDHRVVRNRADGLRRSVLKPRRPIRPIRPLPPKQGLFLPALTLPNEDVFQGLVRPLTALTTLARLHRIYTLEGASLVAADSTFLGLLSRNRIDEMSLANPTSQYGNPRSELSIFNQRGTYGRIDSDLSPFSISAQTPPLILRDGAVLQHLSRNSSIEERIDPNALLAWLAMG